jgi:hypothetical protein
LEVADLSGGRVEKHLAVEPGGVRQVVGADGASAHRVHDLRVDPEDLVPCLWMPSSPLISSADKVLKAVLQLMGSAQLERPARLKVPRVDVMLIGDPLDHDTIDPSCQPPTNASSTPFELNHFLPLPKGSS